MFTAMVYAQTPELTPDSTEPNETKNDAPQLPDIEETKTTENTEEDEEYNIYKKENPVDPCDRGLDTYDYEKSWYDDTQIYINSAFCEPALWFDNFFGSDRIFAEGAPGTYVRWRNDFSYDEEDYFQFVTDLSFSVELPGLQDRLRLTFEADDDENLRDVAPGGEDDARNTLGLQLDIVENVRSKFNVSVSFKPRIRLRYRYTYPVLQNTTLRFTQEVQREEELNSARTLFELEQVFEQRFLFRSSTEGKFSEDFDGVDWLQAFVLYQRVNKKTSLSYETSATGISEPQSMATDYRVGVRFRQNFHRKWLFYEVAPEMTWPVTLDESRENVVTDRRSKWQMFFRIEVHFGNAAKKRYEDHN